MDADLLPDSIFDYSALKVGPAPDFAGCDFFNQNLVQSSKTTGV